MAKKTKAWKYEEDCLRQEDFINVTGEHGKPPAPQWAHLARFVIRSLRMAKAESTPLALHFVAVSATEMLEGRHVNAKLCLLTALTLANRGLLAHQMSLFHSAFSRPQEQEQPDLMQMLSKSFGSLLSKLTSLPEGESVVQLAPGMEAHVHKHFLGAPKGKKKKAKFDPFQSNPRLN